MFLRKTDDRNFLSDSGWAWSLEVTSGRQDSICCKVKRHNEMCVRMQTRNLLLLLLLQLLPIWDLCILTADHLFSFLWKTAPRPTWRGNQIFMTRIFNLAECLSDETIPDNPDMGLAIRNVHTKNTERSSVKGLVASCGEVADWSLLSKCVCGCKTSEAFFRVTVYLCWYTIYILNHSSSYCQVTKSS